MPLDAKNYPPGSPVYTFVANDGENIHIDPFKLRDWTILAKPEILLTPVDREVALSFISNNVVSLQRITELARRFAQGEKPDPIIFCQYGGKPSIHLTEGTYVPDAMLVDGHHRYFIAAAANVPYVSAHILTPEQWAPFRIIGAMSITQEILRAAPISPRDY